MTRKTKQQIMVFDKILSIVESVKGHVISTVDDYINSKSIIEYICGYCGSHHEDNYLNIANRKGFCNNCTSQRKSNISRNSQDRIVKEFSENGVKVLSEYKRNNIPLKLECSCGNLFERRYVHVSRDGYLCLDCKNDFKYQNEIIELENFVIDNGCKLISRSKYRGNMTEIKFKCTCGKEYEKRYDYFKLNPYCNDCTKEIRSTGKRNLTNDEVKEYIESNSECILLSTNYINRESTLLLKCHCGDTFETFLPRFQYEDKRQCNSCGRDRISGENSILWKGGITPETQKIRHSKEYVNWRISVFERDNYTCQCCEDNSGGNLQAHHINNFASNEELRFEIYNGITLCATCHDFRNIGSFHNIYGTHYNDILQLQEYFDDIRTELNLPLIDIEKDIVFKGYIIEEEVG